MSRELLKVTKLDFEHMHNIQIFIIYKTNGSSDQRPPYFMVGKCNSYLTLHVGTTPLLSLEKTWFIAW